MITLDVARAHIDELHREAADYRRAAAAPSAWRRLFSRTAKRS